MATTIVLVRHGQTEWNRVERFRGRFDVPLNATGQKQAEQTAARIASQWKPTAIYASPLSRAMDTAQTIAKKFDLPVIPTDGLVDIEYGQWQGLSPEDASKQWPEGVKNWYRQPEMAEIPGGESLSQVRERAMRQLRALVNQHPDQVIVLVSHTVVNRLILLGILGLSNQRFWRLRQEPCAINVIEAADGEFTLVKMNDTCHLDA